jgi:thioredoxin-related protein
MCKTISIFIILLLFPFTSFSETTSGDFDNFENSADGSFDDSPVKPEIIYPYWFKQSFLDLKEDMEEAKNNNKKGIIVYFGQKHCAYCLALMKNDFGREDIASYVQTHFDVIAINIWGSKEITTPNGQVMTEREFAQQEKANLTPSLVFYDTQGKRTYMLRGYYPPYKFRAAMEYVAEDYYKEENFADYINRADPPPKFDIGDMNEEDFFEAPPFALDRTHFTAEKPLLVFFEQRNCHACDVLHSKPLQHSATKKLLESFEVVQIDINSDTPVWTPDGQKISSKQWAKELNLFYTPTIIAFDEKGKEIMRVDSVAHIYRLKGILEFMTSKSYITTPDFMAWRFNVIFKDKKLPKQ